LVALLLFGIIILHTREGASQPYSPEYLAGAHNKVDECKFDDIEDMVRQVNEKSLNHARSVGKDLDSDGDGRNDALQGKYWGNSNALGYYMCSEFSAYLQCILQELFGCSEDQVKSIADNRHMINKLSTSMFRNPPQSRNGYVWFEPQNFFTDPIRFNALRNGELKVYPKPQPHREGIHRTNYSDLQCTSGPGMRGDGSGASGSGGLFGGGPAGTSQILTALITSMMLRMGGTTTATLGPLPATDSIAGNGRGSGSGGASAPDTALSSDKDPATVVEITVTPTKTATPIVTVAPTTSSTKIREETSADVEQKLFPSLEETNGGIPVPEHSTGEEQESTVGDDGEGSEQVAREMEVEADNDDGAPRSSYQF
jgi:hypothetical protein